MTACSGCFSAQRPELYRDSSGKERDETGLDYFGARYFSGALGRFTGADNPFADQYTTDPQSWNLYTYARNNPLRYVDPNGQSWRDVVNGAVNAIKSNFVLGIGRDTGNQDYKTGQKIGDIVSIGLGLYEANVGIGGATGGGALVLTGAGTAPGVAVTPVTSISRGYYPTGKK